MSLPAGSPASYDWRSLYDGLVRTRGLPCSSGQTVTSAQATVRGLLVNLADVHGMLTSAHGIPPVTVIYADVLQIPSGFTWTADDSALMIVARRIEAGAGAGLALDLRGGPAATAVVFADELAGRLDVQAITVGDEGDGAGLGLEAPPATGGVQFHYHGTAAVATARTRAQGMAMTPTPSFQQALTTAFIAASLLYQDQPELALAQLEFVTRWAAESPDFADLLYRSSSLHALLQGQLAAQATGARFVPFLSADIYGQLAKDFVAEAQKYEDSYQQLCTLTTAEQGFRELAKTLLANQTSKAEYTNALVTQGLQNYANAKLAVIAAQAALRNAKLDADHAQIDFKIGVDEYTRGGIAAAVFSMVEALATLGVGVAAVLFGDLAGTAGAAAGVQKAADAAADAAWAGKGVADTATRAAQAAEQLKKTVEAINELYEFSKTVAEASGSIDDAESLAQAVSGDLLAGALGGTSSTADWQAYQLAAEEMLADPIGEKVEGARELKTAIDTVVVYGLAVCDAQLAAIVAGQQCTTAKLRAELAARQQKQLQEYASSFGATQAHEAELLQALFQRRLDARESLFGAIESYRAAFFYWALAPSTVRCSVVDDVRTLSSGLRTLTAIDLDRTSTFETLFDVQPMPGETIVTITESGFLSALKSERVASWLITLDDDAFAGYDRVRITTVRVWLEGAMVPVGTPVNVGVTTSGQYRDRLRGKSYTFTTKPLERGFDYRVTQKQPSSQGWWPFDDGTYGAIAFDGTRDAEVSFAYFVPTPFTLWTIDLKEINKSIDISQLSKVTLQFSGSAIRHHG